MSKYKIKNRNRNIDIFSISQQPNYELTAALRDEMHEFRAEKDVECTWRTVSCAAGVRGVLSWFRFPGVMEYSASNASDAVLPSSTLARAVSLA